jgi:nitrite transporter NirC
MPNDALRALGVTAHEKATHCCSRPWSYLVSAMLAGAYVGVGVFVALAVGGPFAAAHSPWLKVAMGASFAIALSLVVFAGGELFTGNAMTMPVGWRDGRLGLGTVLRTWGMSWVGNLLGAVLLGALLFYSGVLNGSAELGLVQQLTEKKVSLGIPALLARGILCNWLVCLAVWCCYRMTSESGKLIMIFWCLYAFVATGFEHSVANMTLFSVAFLQPHGPAVTLAGMGHNLLWVTLGNLLGGAVFVAGAYRLVAHRSAAPLTHPAVQ